MLLLVTDTSGKNGSVALVRGDAGPSSSTGMPAPHEIQLIESVPLTGGTFSAQLVPQIAALLEKHRFTKAAIDAFIVVSGPGSFTGLRVGLAAIKALAEILGKPIVPVSALEVAALASETEGKVLAVLDAGRGEIYAGEYDVTGQSAELVRESLMAKDQLASISKETLISLKDQSLAQIARDAGLRVFTFESLSAEMIARIGLMKLNAGKTVAPDELDANYIRRSVAEIFSKPAR